MALVTTVASKAETTRPSSTAVVARRRAVPGAGGGLGLGGDTDVHGEGVPSPEDMRKPHPAHRVDAQSA